MPQDLVAQYSSVRAALQEEKSQLEQKLQAINDVLGNSPFNTPAPPSTNRTVPGKRGRSADGTSLKSHVLQALANGPLSKEEILSAVQRNGYTFNSKDPANSLGVILYGSKPKFSRENGRFGLPKGFKAPSASQTDVGGSTPSGKRKVSPEARARMAAAQRARWAKAGKAQGNNNGVVDKPKRQMSAAGRKRIAEAAKRRWAAARAAGRTRS